MNIAFVSDSIYPYNMGGKEKRLFELSTRLSKKGHNVHVYTMHWWDAPEKTRLENGVTLHAVSRKYPLYNGDIRSIKQGVMFALGCFKIIRESFDFADVDHMPYFPLYSMRIVCWLKRKPMVAPWHEAWGRAYWVEYMGWKGNIAAIIERIGVMLPDKIMAISDYTRQRLADEMNRKKNVSVVLCGIDYNEIQTVSAAIQPIDIIFVGRLLSHKNADLLLKSIKLLLPNYPELSVEIVGKGPESDALSTLAKSLGVESHVTFIERLPESNDVYAHMKAARVFAFPSEREGFGIVVVESIACNTPVVTLNTNTNVSRTLIEESVTGTITKKNPEEFAASLKYWLDQPRPTIAQHAARYDWDIITNKLESEYVKS